MAFERLRKRGWKSLNVEDAAAEGGLQTDFTVTCRAMRMVTWLEYWLKDHADRSGLAKAVILCHTN